MQRDIQEKFYVTYYYTIKLYEYPEDLSTPG
jgi:hypothetical protein